MSGVIFYEVNDPMTTRELLACLLPKQALFLESIIAGSWLAWFVVRFSEFAGVLADCGLFAGWLLIDIDFSDIDGRSRTNFLTCVGHIFDVCVVIVLKLVRKDSFSDCSSCHSFESGSIRVEERALAAHWPLVLRNQRTWAERNSVGVGGWDVVI